MTAIEIIKNFNNTDCPVAAINDRLELVEVNACATGYVPIFTENGLKDLLSAEEALEISHYIARGKNIGLRPKNGAFKGSILEFIPADESAEDFAALVFMTDIGYHPIKNSPESEQYFMARFFEPKMREAVVSIFSNIDMIRNSQATVLSDKSEENLESIACEAYRILRWADHVRLISSLEAGEMNITASDIVEFTKSLVDSAKIMLMGYDIFDEYRIDTEATRHTCSFDREIMTRALLCLISNACKAAGRGSIIKICVTLTDSDYRFTITNGGAHIPSHLLPHVAEPYFTYKNSGEDKRGTGLGLTIAKTVAESHGGNLLLQSSQEFGTTVMLRIPVVFNEGSPNFLGQSPKEYLTDRYSAIFVELYGF